MQNESSQAPKVIRCGSSEGTPLGTSGRARLKVLNEPGDGTGYALIEGSHPSGEPRIRDHVHLRHEESFVVLEGQYQVRLGQDIVVADAGDYVFIPRGTPHTYRNAGTNDARLLNIMSPSDGVQLLAELGALAGMKVDEALLAEIHSRYDARLVAPLLEW